MQEKLLLGFEKVGTVHAFVSNPVRGLSNRRRMMASAQME